MSDFGTQYTQSWAYDLAKNVITDGEVYDSDAIEQSIENIIATIFGERLFFSEFGSSLSFVLFENVDARSAETVLDNVIDSVKRWEKRITISSKDCRLNIDSDNNSLSFKLPYTINTSNIKNVFERRIRF